MHSSANTSSMALPGRRVGEAIESRTHRRRIDKQIGIHVDVLRYDWHDWEHVSEEQYHVVVKGFVVYSGRLIVAVRAVR